MLRDFAQLLPELLKEKKWLAERLLGSPPYIVFDIDPEELERAYGYAYSLFEQKQKSASCSSLFFVLVMLSPENDRYWLALGMSYQIEENLEKAIDAYEMAALLALSHPVPYFYLGKCLYLIGDREAALEAFLLAIEYAQEDASMESVLVEAQEAYRFIKELKEK